MNAIALYIKLYLTAAALFVVLDGLWISTVAAGFYKKHLGVLMSATPNVYAIALFYAVYIACLVALVIQPGMGKTVASAFVLGAVAGLMAYGTYDLTNQAIIKDWPWIVTVTDIAWGSLVSGAVAAATVYIARTFFSL